MKILKYLDVDKIFIDGRIGQKQFLKYFGTSMLAAIVLFILAMIIVILVVYFGVYFDVFGGDMSEVAGRYIGQYIGYIVGCLSGLPCSIAVYKRLHDANKSIWNLFWAFTIIGVIPIIYWLFFKESVTTNNKYFKDNISLNNVY
jgi:uncharacterized membrane protein YhaH (DUF805 family)